MNALLRFVAFLGVAGLTCWAQNPQPLPDTPSAAQQHPPVGQPLPVNWLYGAYVPTEAPLQSLSPADRWHLYLRQGFTTPGIWVKTALFTISDQATESPPGWPQDPEGFGKRVGTRYAQFLMQNSFTALGSSLVGWEPRYDRCRNCTSVGQRVMHGITRNFFTYAEDEKSLRPQVFLYAGSFGGAALAATWQPYQPDPLVKGYQGIATQAWVGVLSNWLAEFTPDFKRAIGRNKKPAPDASNP
jgi:hypothetical protein